MVIVGGLLGAIVGTGALLAISHIMGRTTVGSMVNTAGIKTTGTKTVLEPRSSRLYRIPPRAGL
jgi:hypothetical protein